MQSEMVCRGEPSLDSILAARALTKERLGVACSEDHCNKLALEIPKWKILCPYIGLKEQDEEDIEADYKNNKERKIGQAYIVHSTLEPMMSSPPPPPPPPPSPGLI